MTVQLLNMLYFDALKLLYENPSLNLHYKSLKSQSYRVYGVHYYNSFNYNYFFTALQSCAGPTLFHPH